MLFLIHTLKTFHNAISTRSPFLLTIFPGIPNIVQLEGTFLETTQLAPILEFPLMIISPITFAPDAIKTLSPIVGVPVLPCPIVICWFIEQFFPILFAIMIVLNPC